MKGREEGDREEWRREEVNNRCINFSLCELHEVCRDNMQMEPRRRCGCQTDEQNLILKMSVWVFVCWKWSRLEPVISRWPRLGFSCPERDVAASWKKSLFSVSELAGVGVRKWWRWGELWFSHASSSIFPYPACLYLSAVQPRLPISVCGCVYSREPAVNEMYPLFTGPLSR